MLDLTIQYPQVLALYPLQLFIINCQTLLLYNLQRYKRIVNSKKK